MKKVENSITPSRKRGRRWVLESALVHGLLLFGATQSMAQDPTGNGTMLPTVIDNATMSPTYSLNPSASPSWLASGSPSPFPTATVSPTLFPSESLKPTTIPTASMAPSASFIPSESSMPSDMPSEVPSMKPSKSMQPSLAPTASPGPSISSPPSMIPSESPFSIPTKSPTAPTHLPSQSPSGRPSAELSSQPTLTTREFTKNTIFMVLEGLTGELSEEEIEKWEVVTSQHVLNYYAEFKADEPELVPVNITSVDTVFLGQTIIEPGDSDSNRRRLKIQYNQTIVVGFHVEELEDEEIDFFIFIAPYEYDSQAYLLALVETLDLEEWILLIDIAFGEPTMPTSSPTPKPEDKGELNNIQTALISVVVVFIVCSILYVSWDRFKKEDRFRASQLLEQVNETMEYDNAGQPVDWRNPYNDQHNDQHNNPNGLAPQPPPPPPPQDANAPPRTNSSGHRRSGSNATIPTQNSHSRHSSRGDATSTLPPLPPLPQPSNSGRHHRSGDGRTSPGMGHPPSREDNMRHTSITDTELTDITYSDGGGGGRSDSGSDFNIGLSTIHDERFDDDNAPLSPLHIPDEETIPLTDLSPPPSPPSGDLLGLAVDRNSPSMSGFDLQIEELE